MADSVFVPLKPKPVRSVSVRTLGIKFHNGLKPDLWNLIPFFIPPTASKFCFREFYPPLTYEAECIYKYDHHIEFF